MYRTQYKTLYRVHTLEEALAYEIQASDGPFSVHDRRIRCAPIVASNQLPMLSKLMLRQLRTKFSTCILKNYHRMYQPIPGALLGWTESMLMWIILLSIIDIQHWGSTMELTPKVMAWVKKHAVRMFEDPDLTIASNTVVSQLSTVSAWKWHELEPCEELESFWKSCGVSRHDFAENPYEGRHQPRELHGRHPQHGKGTVDSRWDYAAFESFLLVSPYDLPPRQVEDHLELRCLCLSEAGGYQLGDVDQTREAAFCHAPLSRRHL